MADFPKYAQLANLAFIEDLYRKYLADPQSVDSSWAHFFEGIDFASFLNRGAADPAQRSLRIEKLRDAYRRHGHLLASFNSLQTAKETPFELELKTLGFSDSELEVSFPTLGLLASDEAPLKEIVAALQNIYSSRMGFEYMGLDNPEMEAFLQQRIEPHLVIDLNEEEQKRLLEGLIRAEVFETFIHTKYVGQKRFSLEGNDTLIPLLAEIIRLGSQMGVETFVLGMAHRGRLNVLANILQKPYSVLFKEFDDAISYLPGEAGDVKYHKGYASLLDKVELYLSANSSCLESVDGIVLGETKAYQRLYRNNLKNRDFGKEAPQNFNSERTTIAERQGVSENQNSEVKPTQPKTDSSGCFGIKQDEAMGRVVPILMHGDAAMAGQGVFYESLQMGKLEGFRTGGTLQIAINNQLGFTTTPQEGRSTRYCTDVAKTFGAPVFHVNAEDPESCLWAARLAVEIRQKFQCDVFIDLNGYRKYGHNETDEPGFTQPVHYSDIRARPTIRQKYVEARKLETLAEGIEEEFKAALNRAWEQAKVEQTTPPQERFGSRWIAPPKMTLLDTVKTSVDAAALQQIASAFCRIPQGFQMHPKLEKLLQQRLAMVEDPKKTVIDWGMGECLGLASLVWQGVAVRLTGQDSCRGTFSHRHALWFDQKTGMSYAPYSHLKPTQPRCDIYNTLLSEFASLGFEFGYSWIDSNTFVCWEAQYGDFVIGAEILIDHYITAAEQKWASYSSLTLLLPHGYQGEGPEHSSGRMERFLQLAAQQNIQVVNPTTPAQYFHLLRRQALRPLKKPLIVFSPKSLIRLSECVSPMEDFTKGGFEEILDDETADKKAKRILLCTGKIYYDFLASRKEFSNSAIIRLEQIYPLHVEKLKSIFAKYKMAKEIFWVQEEPENMGAWEFLSSQLPQLLPPGISLQYVARPRSGSTATGSFKQHKREQEAILSRVKG